MVTTSRYLALNGLDTQQLARILDETEYLLTLMRFGEAEPGEFRNHLRSIGERFPDFANILAEFDSKFDAGSNLPHAVEYETSNAEAA